MGFLVGGAYAAPVRKALNAYRKKLRPGKGATVTQILKSLDALDPGARATMGERDQTKTKARKLLRLSAAIKTDVPRRRRPAAQQAQKVRARGIGF